MPEITHQIRNHCMGLIEEQLNMVLDAAAGYLAAIADRASQPKERDLYLATTIDLDSGRQQVFSTFSELIAQGFDDLTASPGSNRRVKTGGIDTSNVRGTRNIEEKMALETMIDKAKIHSELPMQSIIRSLNGLMGDDWVQRHQNPLEPEVFVTSWLEAVHTIKLPAEGYLALYGLFDSKMLGLLPKLYDKIAHYLDDLPIRSHSKIKPAKYQDNNSSQDYEQAFGDIDEPAIMPDFIHSDLTSSDTAATVSDEINFDDDPEPERRTDDLIRLLDSLQRKRDLDDSQYYAGNYLLDLRGLLVSYNAVPEGEINPWTVGQINDDVIDMTGLMFSFIMEDAYLPEDIRYHISRLQIPYLKLGLQDKSIFSNKNHPARELLRDLAQSISLWDPTHASGLDMLLNETVAIIDDILLNYKMDSQIFSNNQQRFSNFLSGDQHVDEEMQQRQQATATKTAKADNARLYIESTLDQICDKKRIPPVVNQILEDFWSKVLFLEFLKAGQDSDDFATFIVTTDMLVDSVQAKKSELDRKKMAKQLPHLIKRLKDGFATISVAAFETVELFRMLQECHMLVLKERPELEVEDEFEVSEQDYEAFQRDQNSVSEWNRTDLENALLEESIERSLSRSDTDIHAFDDNRNIIISKQNVVQDATIAKAVREREVIDHELQEARDAYEQALKDHQQQKAKTPSNDEDDFMAQFFQDPEFLENQEKNLQHPTPANRFSAIKETADLTIKEEFFDQLADESSHPVAKPVDAKVPQDGLTDAKEKLSEQKKTVEHVSRSSDQLSGRAHGALEDGFNELGDTQVAELIERLKVGLWVDLFNADGSQSRAKIMAIVPTVGKYIFGNRQGKKIADYNKQSLAQALRSGQIRVSEEDNVFDKTLESVIANLRVMKKAEDD